MIWYMASPYSKYADGQKAAWIEASKQNEFLIANNIFAYSPIAHTHSLVECGDSLIDPLDWERWMNFDRAIIQKMDGLIVLMLSGWNESKGVLEEISIFRNANKPVVFMEPNVIPDELR